eukprot:g5453.t1
MSRFDGKLALITASTAGIGLEIARKLGSEGARVVISSRRESNVQKAERVLLDEGIVVKGVVCHVGKRDDIRNLVQEALRFGNGKIDVVISNAAANPSASTLAATNERSVDTILNINIKAPIMLVIECIPYLAKNANIIFNSSVAAFHQAGISDTVGMYSVSKTALLGLTKAFANELGKTGIRVNCVAPGMVRTKFSSMFLDNQESKQKVISLTALKRLGTTHEIADVVAFLASYEAAYITGEIIVVSGGMQSRL